MYSLATSPKIAVVSNFAEPQKIAARLRSRSTSALRLFLLMLSSTVAHAENKSLDDLFLGVWSPFASKWETSIPLCIWTDTQDSFFRVTATGLQPGNTYYVVNDIGDLVNYTVFLHFGKNLKRKQKLKSGIPSRSSFTFSDNRQCADGPTARVKVRLNKNEIRKAPTGIYNDTLMLLFTPI